MLHCDYEVPATAPSFAIRHTRIDRAIVVWSSHIARSGLHAAESCSKHVAGSSQPRRDAVLQTHVGERLLKPIDAG